MPQDLSLAAIAFSDNVLMTAFNNFIYRSGK
nr:MAG TPA_asm: hypothetical protein [Caudoviricetes sp.]